MAKAIALFLERESNPYMRNVHAEAEAEAREHGLQVETFFSDNRFLQIEQLYSSIRAQDGKPQAVAVLPAHEDGLGRVARAALARGIDWISLHRRAGDLDELQREFPKCAVTYVAPDQIEVGRVQGRLARRLAVGGRVLYVQGSRAHFSAAQRLQGFREVVDPKREIVGLVDGNWSTEDTRGAVERWLHVMLPSVSRLDVVVCQNDTMAVGARSGLRAVAAEIDRPELARVPVVGCDGLAEVGRRLVDDGELAATVRIEGVGRRLVRVLVDRLLGNRPDAEIIVAPSAYPALPADANDAREPVGTRSVG
jgi:ABC-type sugar transport system substrate-binding protein